MYIILRHLSGWRGFTIPVAAAWKVISFIISFSMSHSKWHPNGVSTFVELSVDIESFWSEGYTGQSLNGGHKLAIHVLLTETCSCLWLYGILHNCIDSTLQYELQLLGFPQSFIIFLLIISLMRSLRLISHWIWQKDMYIVHRYLLYWVIALSMWNGSLVYTKSSEFVLAYC